MSKRSIKTRLTDLELMIHHQTDKAVLVSADDNREGAVWLAKSQVEFEEEPVVGRAQIVTMPEQLAFEKGLV
ncbi:MAG: hypothetical protein M9955_15540 [Rhizobiaceae bacterium]|nr:hypothetical protein [Rhizobiaceae bacterium]